MATMEFRRGERSIRPEPVFVGLAGTAGSISDVFARGDHLNKAEIHLARLRDVLRTDPDRAVGHAQAVRSSVEEAKKLIDPRQDSASRDPVRIVRLEQELRSLGFRHEE